MAESTSIEASPEKSTSLGWTCHPHGRQQTTEATDVLGARFWEAKQGRPLKRFKDFAKASISHAEITPKELEPRAHDRTGWRALTRRSATVPRN